MCIISGEIKEVSKTKIFCSLNKNKTRQITIYSNEVDSMKENNLMILPVPFINSVKFHNLSQYKDFFNDCSQSFHRNLKSYGSLSMNRSIKSNALLEVFDVGSYKVSVLENLNDVARLNPEYFYLTNDVVKYLKNHYDNELIGFIICKLDVGKKQYHPFAFSHNSNSDKLYIPTRHYHVHSNDGFDNSDKLYAPLSSSFSTYSENLENTNNNPNNSENNKKIIFVDDYNTDDWDHEIYIYNATKEGNKLLKNKNEYGWNKTINIDFELLDFDIDKDCKNFEKIRIKGVFKNTDLFVKAI